MQQEIEAKFLNQDHNEIRRKLEALGASCVHPMSLMRRTIFDFPDRRLQKKHAWVRLREELDGSIEVTLKQVNSDELTGVHEYPIIVNNFEAAKNFLLSIGLEVKGEQESKRELWRYRDVEIMLDEWPWVKPFIEIEAPSEVEVKDFATKLNLDLNEAKFGGVNPVYVAEYNITTEEFIALELSMKFTEPIPKALTK